MSTSTDFRPKGGNLAVRVESRPVEVSPSTSQARRGVDRPTPPASSATKSRKARSRRRRGPGAPIAWLSLILACPLALALILALLAWWSWPGLHRAGDIRVDLLIEGVWRVGGEAVAKK